MISSQLRGRYFIFRSRKVCCTVTWRAREASSASSSRGVEGALGELRVGADRAHGGLAEQHAALAHLDDLEAGARRSARGSSAAGRNSIAWTFADLSRLGRRRLISTIDAADPAAVEGLALFRVGAVVERAVDGEDAAGLEHAVDLGQRLHLRLVVEQVDAVREDRSRRSPASGAGRSAEA